MKSDKRKRGMQRSVDPRQARPVLKQRLIKGLVMAYLAIVAVVLIIGPPESPETVTAASEPVSEVDQTGQASVPSQRDKPVKPAAPPRPPPRTLLTSTSLPSAHLCFFSLNNPLEYKEMLRLTSVLQRHSPLRIQISEFQLPRAKPLKSFKKVIRSQVRCDGIVLSGHFRDEYYGDRARGDLEIEDLMELSCEPKYADWFAQVNALWLQGCNTMKPSIRNEDLDEDDRDYIGGSPLARMRREYDPRDMEDSVEDMLDVLIENTNEENFALEFQRVFPNATVFGWTDKSPGENAGSDRSLPFHIAHTSRVIDRDPRVFANPLVNRIPPAAARRYAEILYGMLRRPLKPHQDFPSELNEANFIKGWTEHGNFRNRYAFDNHHLRGYTALSRSHDEVLRQIKGLACLEYQIDEMEDEPDRQQLAEHILASRDLYEYNSYFLDAMLREAGHDFGYTLHGLMRNSQGFKQYLSATRRAPGYRGQDANNLLSIIRQAPKPPPATAKKD